MGRTFHGGVPYSVDVRRLTEALPATLLTEGREINHSQLEGVVNSPKGSQRYYGVLNSWIGQMKHSHGIFIVWQPGLGIKVLTPAAILDHAEVKTRQKMRQTGRAVNIYGWVDRGRLNTLGQQKFDHQKRVLAAFGDAMQNARKEMSITVAPIESLPRPKLLKDTKEA